MSMVSELRTTSALSADPAKPSTAYNEVHPPLMVKDDQLSAERSDTFEVGRYKIPADQFDKVIDPDYNWQKYIPSQSDPAAGQQIKSIKAKQQLEIEYYEVVRQRFWSRTRVQQYADDTMVTVTTHHGLTTHNGQTKDTTLTQSISIGLGLAFPGGEVGDVAEAVPVALMATSSALDMHFTYDFSRTLHFMTTHDQTYTDEKTETIQYTYLGGYLYLWWALVDQLVLTRSRKAPTKAIENVSTMRGANDTAFTQKFKLPNTTGVAS